VIMCQRSNRKLPGDGEGKAYPVAKSCRRENAMYQVRIRRFG